MGKYVFPCPEYTRVSSPFGMRKHPTTGVTKLHDGIDYACPAGKPILATAAGTVSASGPVSGWGKRIMISHGNGLITLYAHASKLLVSKGDKVKAGQTIALVGSTGNSTGNHLHFGMYFNGTARDPAKYVSPKDTNSVYSDEAESYLDSSQANEDAGSKQVEITKTVVKSTLGKAGVYKFTNLKGAGQVMDVGYELLIQNDQIYQPVIEGDITLEYERQGSPGVLKFNVLKDSVLNIQEGNPVRFRVNGNNVFYGYLFSKSRKDDKIISLTCYDQLRYLKNKDTLIYDNKTYGRLLKEIADDYGLKWGIVEDTKYIIPHRVEDNATLFDILGAASDLTTVNTGKIYVLYDDFGNICLREISSMLLPLLIDSETCSSYSYTTSIDQNTYNRIKLSLDNEDTGERELYIANSEDSQARWGILQYYESVSNGTPAEIQERASLLLPYYNKLQRTLSLSKCLGDIRVRGGSSVCVNLALGDIQVQGYMLVEKVKHTFANGEHWMDLNVSGIRGEFVV